MKTISVKFNYRLIGKSVKTNSIEKIDVEEDSDELGIKRQILWYFNKFIDNQNIVEVYDYEIINRLHRIVIN